jgi:hypothetical protein
MSNQIDAARHDRAGQCRESVIRITSEPLSWAGTRRIPPGISEPIAKESNAVPAHDRGSRRASPARRLAALRLFPMATAIGGEPRLARHLAELAEMTRITDSRHQVSSRSARTRRQLPASFCFQ